MEKLSMLSYDELKMQLLEAQLCLDMAKAVHPEIVESDVFIGLQKGVDECKIILEKKRMETQN